MSGGTEGSPSPAAANPGGTSPRIVDHWRTSVDLAAAGGGPDESMFDALAPTDFANPSSVARAPSFQPVVGFSPSQFEATAASPHATVSIASRHWPVADPAAACGCPDADMFDVLALTRLADPDLVAFSSTQLSAALTPSPSSLAVAAVSLVAVGGTTLPPSRRVPPSDLLMLEATPVSLLGRSALADAPVGSPSVPDRPSSVPFVGSFSAFQQPPPLSSNFAPRHASYPASTFAHSLAKAAP